jgi:hypothetical protein
MQKKKKNSKNNILGAFLFAFRKIFNLPHPTPST